MELVAAPSLTNGRRIVRALAVLVFATGLALSGARVVGTRFEPILFIPAAIAVLVGWLSSRRHIIGRVLSFALAFVGSGFLVAFASDGTTTSFTRGLLDGPRQVVTTAWPSPRFPTIFVGLAALIFVGTAAAIDLAMRVRWRAMAIVPLVVAMVALIAVGAPDGPQWQAVVCAAAAAFVLLWIGLDDRVASVRAGLLVAIAAGLAALMATLGVGVAVADRANPRHREAPIDQLSLLDPLAEIAAQTKANVPADLYKVESPALDQLPRWRTAALDVYNGESWSTSGRLTPIGNRIDEPTGAEQVTVRITAEREDTLLWPIPGRLLRSTSPIESDLLRRVVRIIGTDRPVATVFTVEPLPDFDPTTAGTVERVQATDIESSFKSLAMNMAGDGTVADQVATLAAKLQDEYKLNKDTAGGVQQNLINVFLRNTRVGNAEQFVTGFVLLARSLGVDARIATGYELATDGTSPATISTSNAFAWAEVRVEAGWAVVDVVPDTSSTDPPETQPVGQPETPPAAQPLPPPQVDQAADPDKPVEAPLSTTKASRWSGVRVWALRGGLFTGLLLWPLIVFAGIVTWKKVRRRKGLKAADPARRVSTAWTLATDALIDAGATLHTSHTNAELVEAGVKTQPGAGPSLGRLQRHADAVTFASASCDPKRASDAVDQLRLVESSIRNSSSRWWRWKWWLSTRSLRRGTQSPLR
ncbi:MAG: transglutaminaseTgpA domain-containing protein [Ilumatobacteraceae bacterium]